jgi:hypothetical protein
MKKFTQMVWKDSTKVGFGIRGKWVVAWYCDSAGNTGSPSNYVANVGEECIITNRVNKCYNDLAVEAHNNYRKEHEAPNLTWVSTIAEKLQTAMNN